MSNLVIREVRDQESYVWKAECQSIFQLTIYPKAMSRGQGDQQLKALGKAQDRWILGLKKYGSASQGVGVCPAGTNKGADNGTEVAGQEIDYLIRGICPIANVGLQPQEGRDKIIR